MLHKLDITRERSCGKSIAFPQFPDRSDTSLQPLQTIMGSHDNGFCEQFPCRVQWNKLMNKWGEEVRRGETGNHNLSNPFDMSRPLSSCTNKQNNCRKPPRSPLSPLLIALKHKEAKSQIIRIAFFIKQQRACRCCVIPTHIT